jgi:hypothetical protein
VYIHDTTEKNGTSLNREIYQAVSEAIDLLRKKMGHYEKRLLMFRNRGGCVGGTVVITCRIHMSFFIRAKEQKYYLLCKTYN